MRLEVLLSITRFALLSLWAVSAFAVEDDSQPNFFQSNGFQGSVGPSIVGGQWYQPPNSGLNIQAIHAALLPSGHVVLVNGSSNRNGIIAKSTDLRAINNTAILDPTNLNPQNPQ